MSSGVRSVREAFWNSFDKLLDAMAFLSCLIIGFSVLSVCYSVVMRYFFKKPPIWVVQTCEYSLLWSVFLGAAWLLREKGHVVVDIVYSRIGPRAKVWLNLFIFLIGGLCSLTLTFFGVEHVLECIFKGIKDVRAVTVPKHYVFSILPVGAGVLTLQFFRMWFQELKKLR